MQENLIYLDNNSTTKLDPRVLEEMMPYLTSQYGNASSSHIMGQGVSIQIERARESIGDLINSNPEDIIFTAGATESINLALRGTLHHKRSPNANIVTLKTEHSAVLDTCQDLENSGISVRYVNVTSDGIVDFDELNNLVDQDTILVCAMWVNNETGVIQPIGRIAQLAHSKGALLMSDATQAVGKLTVDVLENEVDLLAFSGHKFYGPKGVGALYINQRLKLKPLIFGGGHERGVRSGTLNVPGIVGMGKAASIARLEMNKDANKISLLANQLMSGIFSNHKASLNGSQTLRLCNTMNILFEGVENTALMMKLKHICISTGSACKSLIIEPSHVLLAMGLTKEQANSSLRFSLGRFNTQQDIQFTVEAIKEAIGNLTMLDC